MISVLLFNTFYCRNIAKEILKHENWRKCLRNPTMSGGTLQTTPFRKLIEAMPGYIFNIIIFNYLFIIPIHEYSTTTFCHSTND